MPTKKVVLLKSNLCHVGGVEKYTLRLAQAFANRDLQVTILTTGKSSPAEKFPFDIINLGFPWPLGYLRLKQFDHLCKKWLDANEVDIIFGMDRNTFQTHYRAGNGVHAEYLLKRAAHESLYKRFSFKFNPLHRTILSMEKKAYESPYLRLLFTNSHMVRNEVLKHYKVAERKIRVVHNGVEWQEMQHPFEQWPLKKSELLRKNGLNPDKFQFLFIGNGFSRKGLDFLLKAIAKLDHSLFELSVIGKDKTPEAFIKRIYELKLQNNVKFYGPQKEILSFYQMADTLIVPSIYDPFANVTVEGLAMGLFVITSRFNGGAEVLSTQNGFVIENLFDEDAFLESLKSALKRPKTLDQSIAIRESVKHLDFSHQLNKLVDGSLEEEPTIKVHRIY